LKNKTATKEEKALASAQAKRAQKRYIALGEQVKMVEDNKARALQLAQQKAKE
jgi:hypothetical protein